MGSSCGGGDLSEVEVHSGRGGFQSRVDDDGECDVGSTRNVDVGSTWKHVTSGEGLGRADHVLGYVVDQSYAHSSTKNVANAPCEVSIVGHVGGDLGGEGANGLDDGDKKGGMDGVVRSRSAGLDHPGEGSRDKGRGLGELPGGLKGEAADRDDQGKVVERTGAAVAGREGIVDGGGPVGRDEGHSYMLEGVSGNRLSSGIIRKEKPSEGKGDSHYCGGDGNGSRIAYAWVESADMN